IPGSPSRIAATARGRQTNRAGRRIGAAAACRARRRLRRTTATTRAPARRSRIGRVDFGADPAPPRYRRYQLRATPPPRPTPRDPPPQPWNTPTPPPPPRRGGGSRPPPSVKNKTEIKVVRPPPTAIAGIGCARWSGYGRAILQAGL